MNDERCISKIIANQNVSETNKVVYGRLSTK